MCFRISLVIALLGVTLLLARTADAQLIPTDFGLPGSSSRRSGEPYEARTDHFHEGVDFSTRAPDGDLLSVPFTAGLGIHGVVVEAGGDSFHTIKVKLDNGTTIEYLHAAQVFVKVGDSVGPATKLGMTGSAGLSGPKAQIHLHVQAHDKWTHPIDPDTAWPGGYVRRLVAQPHWSGDWSMTWSTGDIRSVSIKPSGTGYVMTGGWSFVPLGANILKGSRPMASDNVYRSYGKSYPTLFGPKPPPEAMVASLVGRIREYLVLTKSGADRITASYDYDLVEYHITYSGTIAHPKGIVSWDWARPTGRKHSTDTALLVRVK